MRSAVLVNSFCFTWTLCASPPSDCAMCEDLWISVRGAHEYGQLRDRGSGAHHTLRRPWMRGTNRTWARENKPRGFVVESRSKLIVDGLIVCMGVKSSQVS